MQTIRHPQFYKLFLCVLLTACAPQGMSGGSPRDIKNLYELPHNVPSTGHAVPVDNDTYYTQPNTYQGCSFINDAPSCGGG